MSESTQRNRISLRALAVQVIQQYELSDEEANVFANQIILAAANRMNTGSFDTPAPVVYCPNCGRPKV